MADEESQLLTSFIYTLARPEEKLLPLLLGQNETSSSANKKQLRDTCQFLFKEVERFSRTYNELANGPEEAFGSGLDELYTGTGDHPVDAETLWGQVEMQNEALQSLLKKSIKRLVKSAEEDKNELCLLDLGGVISEDENEGKGASDQRPHDDESSVEDEHASHSDEDEEARRMRERMERTMADMEASDSESGRESAERQQGTQTDEESLVDPAAEELNNGFFDINEMEAFADEEEAYLPDEAFGEVKPDEKVEKPKKSFHQRQREGDIDSDGDSEGEENFFGETDGNGESSVRRRKYRENDEINELYKMYETPKGGDDGAADDDDSAVNMTAADFFGKPDKKYFSKWKASEKIVNEENNDADSWDDIDFENDAPGWRDTHVDEEENEKREEVGGHNVKRGDEGEPLEDEPVQTNGEPRTKQSDKLRQQTVQLEKEMLAEKPWQMTGETKSMSRPVNSLLDATPEFEVATKMAPLITVEHTTNLEDIIKRRILNEDWDDVVPRELPDIGWNKKRSELPEVSQEKSKLGLGELYEREYLKKAVGYDVDAAEKQTEEEKAKNEMKALFTNLCSKLDALSNYHFAPRPVSDEADVRPVTTPAIAMEEVMPLHVSDARGVAPEEVYGKKRGRDGVLRGENELDQIERKRLRGAKKAARRKARKEKIADEKLISRLQPGLGLNNPYEKRKIREELSVARAQGKVTAGEVDSNADYGTSGKFFRRMQEEVEQSVKGDGAQRKKKNSKEKLVQKSSAFKL